MYVCMYIAASASISPGNFSSTPPRPHPHHRPTAHRSLSWPLIFPVSAHADHTNLSYVNASPRSQHLSNIYTHIASTTPSAEPSDPNTHTHTHKIEVKPEEQVSTLHLSQVTFSARLHEGLVQASPGATDRTIANLLPAPLSRMCIVISAN